MNAKMKDLVRAFETAGFEDVRTIASSGNVVFTAKRAASNATLERKAEKAMEKTLGKAFATIVRSGRELTKMIDGEPWGRAKLRRGAKRVVTFFKTKPRTAGVKLPLVSDGARVLRVAGKEAFTEYVPSQRGGAFMVVIERTFGKEVTTRTWDAVLKIAGATSRDA